MGITAHSAPSGADRQVKQRIQLEESRSASGFRYKQTDADAHRGSPADPKVERPPTAGWTTTYSRPGPAAGSQLPQDPTYACRHSTAAEARNTADSAGEQQPGRRGNPRPGRWPGSRLSGIAAHGAPSGAETVLGQPGWTRGRAGHQLAAVAYRRGSTRSLPRDLANSPTPLTRTEPANHPTRVSPTTLRQWL